MQFMKCFCYYHITTLSKHSRHLKTVSMQLIYLRVVNTKHGETSQNQYQCQTKYSWQVRPLIETMPTDSKEALEHVADLKSVPWLLTNYQKQQFVRQRLLD